MDQRDISSGSLNLLICRNLNDKQALILRDSISKAHIPGPIDGTFMKTDYDYIASSNVFESEEKLIEETRGLWDVEKQFMGGPFINQKIKTKNKEEVVMLDAFLYAPGEAKRDYLFELEAIMRTFNIIFRLVFFFFFPLSSSSSPSFNPFLNSLIPLPVPLISSGIFSHQTRVVLLLK